MLISRVSRGDFWRKLQDRRFAGSRGFHLLHLELVGPGNGRPPDELVDQHNHRDHRGQPIENAARISLAGRRLKIRAQAGQAEVTLAEHEHLAGHQEEPPAGDGYHRVPNQADRAVGQFKLQELLQAVESIDPRGFPQLFGDRPERSVEAERHVPHLAREDENHRADLDAQLARREQRDHGQHYARQEAQYWDGLQNVERGEHRGLQALVVGGDIGVDDGENQAQQIGGCHPHQRIHRVHGNRPGGARYGCRWNDGAKPVAPDDHHQINHGDYAAEDDGIQEERPGLLVLQGMRLRLGSHRPRPTSFSSALSSVGAGASSGMKKRSRLLS